MLIYIARWVWEVPGKEVLSLWLIQGQWSDCLRSQLNYCWNLSCKYRNLFSDFEKSKPPKRWMVMAQHISPRIPLQMAQFPTALPETLHEEYKSNLKILDFPLVWKLRKCSSLHLSVAVVFPTLGTYTLVWVLLVSSTDSTVWTWACWREVHLTFIKSFSAARCFHMQVLLNVISHACFLFM